MYMPSALQVLAIFSFTFSTNWRDSQANYKNTPFQNPYAIKILRFAPDYDNNGKIKNFMKKVCVQLYLRNKNTSLLWISLFASSIWMFSDFNLLN